MKKRLLDLIVCPICKGNLNLTIFKTEIGKNPEISDGLLHCKCNSWYPIIRGIPRILPMPLQKKILNQDWGKFLIKYRERFPKYINPQFKSELDQFDHVKKKTAQAWGYQWTYFDNFIKESKAQFLKWLRPVKKEFFKNKFVLDAGCGTGRHVYFSNLFGAETTIGVDLSYAVETAQRYNKSPNTHIIQGDIFNMPFKDGIFDYAFSVGVLHHLPDPEKGFTEIVKKVKKNGSISAWVYGKKNNEFITHIIEPLRKTITTNMNLKVLNIVSFFFTIPIFLATKVIYRPMNKFKVTKQILNMLPYSEYFLQLSHFSFKYNWMNVLDKFDAPLANYYSKKEFGQWFARKNLKNISILPVNKISWAGFGKK